MTQAVRAAERNTFTQHRASLMFSGHHAHRRPDLPWSATVHEGAEPLPHEAIATLPRLARLVDGPGGL